MRLSAFVCFMYVCDCLSIWTLESAIRFDWFSLFFKRFFLRLTYFLNGLQRERHVFTLRYQQRFFSWSARVETFWITHFGWNAALVTVTFDPAQAFSAGKKTLWWTRGFSVVISVSCNLVWDGPDTKINSIICEVFPHWPVIHCH